MSATQAFFSLIGDDSEIDTLRGKALDEERYAALRRQVPVIYLVAVTNLIGLHLATGVTLAFGWALPAALLVCAMVRSVQWLKRRKQTISHALMLQQLRQTVLLAAALCVVVSGWCVFLLAAVDLAGRWPVILFGSLTAIGTAYGLSSFPAAARLPLIVLALPLSAVGLFSGELAISGAALSLAVVAALILRLISVHNNHFSGVIQSRFTISEEREAVQRARRDADKAAATDFLTGLANRRALLEKIAFELGRPSSEGRFSLAIIDLDRFKPINDNFGHATGDEILKQVAGLLKEAAGDDAFVARLGGDEFAILFPRTATETAEKLTATLARTVEIGGRQFDLSASCGVATTRRGRARSPLHLLEQADMALYEAKGNGAGRIAFFSPGIKAKHLRRSRIEEALRAEARDGDGLELNFQPIYDLGSGKIIAFEALARWATDELGTVSPAEFMPLAEQVNVIAPISDQLLNKALAEAVKWDPQVKLSFNLSAIQLCSGGAANVILEAVARHRFPTSRLQVEVTETALMGDFGRARVELQILRESGVSIALDDFGAGYASITYLREMEFDQIKLDGSLITASNRFGGKRLLAALIGLCDALNVVCVAEHIETEEQLRMLVSMGCEAGQGYWLHKPVRAEEVRSLSATPAPVRAGRRLTQASQLRR